MKVKLILVVLVLSLGGCGTLFMSNEEIVTESQKCYDAGMIPWQNLPTLSFCMSTTITAFCSERTFSTI